MPHRLFRDATQYATHYFSKNPLFFIKKKTLCGVLQLVESVIELPGRDSNLRPID